MPRVWDVPVHDSTRVRDVRVAAEEAAAVAGLDERQTAAAALVASELATNLLKHAEGGEVLIDVVAPPLLRGGPQDFRVVQIAALDHGPGMPDLATALRDGFTTTGSLGAGLGTCLRLADDFDLHSVLGRGTVAVARVGRVPRRRGLLRLGSALAGPIGGLHGAPQAVRAVRHTADGAGASPAPAARDDRPGGVPAGRPAPGGRGGSPEGPGSGRAPVGRVRAGGVNVPFAGAAYSGDAWTWVRAEDRVTLMMADGLGHGPEAARASTAAVEALHRAAHLTPAEALRELHSALGGTRGAAVAVAQLDLRSRRLRFAGIGNIGARLRQDGAWRSLLSRPGIVGVHRPGTLREEEAAWGDDRMLILHTDGLPSRWTPPSDPDLPRADPAVTAAVTIRDASSSARPVRDDTAVAVLTETPSDRP
ncbi:ATP-binding SpoIIE family protein phosphatase [Streptomyces sp. NPDC052682]|uniref:ATP-binding SpoIIE family protein phosphatase n=1 Tax=Streptomyces sp. NPDC052682 TaxID=3154954 RepID=UPI0034378522